MKWRSIIIILLGIVFFLQAQANSGTVREPVTEEQVIRFFDGIERLGQWSQGILALDQNTQFPIAIRKQMNGITYEIGLQQLRLTPQGNVLDILAMMTTDDGTKLCFFGEQVQFTGAGGIQSGSLRLITSRKEGLKINVLPRVDLEILEGAFHFDCKGYESFSIGGRVIFDRDLMVPENPIYATILAGQVTASFQMERVKDWNDWLLEVSLPPFQITNMPGYGFTAQRVVVDVSRGRNNPALLFPEGYMAADMGPGWLGVSMAELSMRFPPEFKLRQGPTVSSRVGLGVQNLLIDRQGFSGVLKGRDLFPLKAGDLNGWDFSMEEFYLVLLKNKVKEGRMAGQMRLSITEENQPLAYRAVIDPTQDFYQFSIQTPDSLSFPFLKATQVSLTSNSNVQLTLANRQFTAQARLHGQLDIQSKELGLTLDRFEFQDLVVSNQAPFLRIGYLGGGSGRTYEIGNFPISLNGPVILANSTSFKLSLGANLDLDKMGISAKGGFFVEGQMVQEEGRQFWRNKDIGIQSLFLSADLNRFKFRGGAEFFREDPQYGRGFYGRIELETCLPNCAKTTAVGIFGRKPLEEPYWFVDADLELGNQEPKGMQITFLSGTVYKRMKPSGQSSSTRFPSITGMSYIPDNSVGWGARFGVGLSLGSGSSAASAAGGLEVVARKDGSVQSFGIMGMVGVGGQSNQVTPASVRLAYQHMCAGQFVAGEFTSASAPSPQDTVLQNKAVKRFSPSSSDGFYGSILLRFNYDEESFFGRAGFNITQTNFQFAFLGEFYFSPQRWHIHLGQPPIANRMKLRLPSFPGVTFEGYIMLGHGLVALPDPDPNPFTLNPSANKDRKGIQVDQGVDGKGFALGVSASLGSNGRLGRIVQWNVGARIGMDMLAVKFPPGVSCIGFPGPVGMNGWLGSGQAYAVGEVAVTALDRIPVLSIQLGAILRGTAPNPTSAQGQVAVRFKVLTKKFDINLGFEVGDECRLAISDIKEEALAWEEKQFPTRGTTDIDFNTEPHLEFPYPVDQKFTPEDQIGEYRIRPVSFILRDQSGREIEGKGKDKSNRWEFHPKKPLPGNENITGEAHVQLEYKQGGSWVPYIESGSGLKKYAFQFKTRMTPEQWAALQEQRAREWYLRQAQEAELNRILQDEEAKRKALLAHLEDLRRLNEASQFVVGQIDQHVQQTNAALTEVYNEAVARGEEIIDNAHQVANTIFKENTNSFNNLNTIIENSDAPDESIAAAEEAARVAKEAADEAVRQAQAFVQRLVDQATAEVLHTTAMAKQEVQQVRDNSVSQVQQVATSYEHQIQELAWRKQAQLNVLNRQMKAELDGVKWPNRKKKRAEIRQKYNLMANAASRSFNQLIEVLPAQSMREQEQIKEMAKQQMDAILAHARARAQQIMDEAAAQSVEAMNRARQTAQNIMSEAESQVRAILENGPSVMDLSSIARMLQDQSEEFDQAFNQDDFDD